MVSNQLRLEISGSGVRVQGSIKDDDGKTIFPKTLSELDDILKKTTSKDSIELGLRVQAFYTGTGRYAAYLTRDIRSPKNASSYVSEIQSVYKTLSSDGQKFLDVTRSDILKKEREITQMKNRMKSDLESLAKKIGSSKGYTAKISQ